MPEQSADERYLAALAVGMEPDLVVSASNQQAMLTACEPHLRRRTLGSNPGGR